VGEYNFTIVFEDASGNKATDECWITVEDTTSPILTEIPPDQIIELTSIDNLLSWIATDLDPASYSIYRNNELINSSSWISGKLVVEKIDGLAVGEYNFTIIFADTSGNIATDECWITVEDTTRPILTEIPPDQTIELGSSNNLLSWIATDLDPVIYSIFRNNELINSSTWTSGEPVTENIDSLCVGEYNFTIIFEDASGNTATDECWITVEDTTKPILTEIPTDQTIELGSLDNLLSWIATDFDPASYSIFRNNELINSSTWTSGESVTENIDSLSIGKYNFTIIFTDVSGNLVTSETWVDVIDTTAPIISITPADLTYEFGVAGNFLIWVPSDLDPSNYYIYQNDVQIKFRDWISTVPVIHDVDNLPIGFYNITIKFLDVSGNSAIDEVFVTVEDTTPPVIVVSPPDLTFGLDTPVTLFWLATDLAPDNYSLNQDGNEVNSGSWSNGTLIILTIDSLDSGTYNFTIIISDTSGNQAYDSVMVTIKDLSATTSQSTQSSHPTTQPTPGFEFFGLLTMMITGALLNLYRRKRRGD
ncbi:MAG: hypothetical protein ACFFDC_17190, partial [Promethearchaeota archaeon]